MPVTGAPDAETSAEMSEKLRAHQSTLSALLDRVSREAAEPLERELATLRAALRREACDGEDEQERAKPVPPEANCFVADIDAALVQQVLGVPKRRGEPDIEHHG